MRVFRLWRLINSDSTRWQLLARETLPRALGRILCFTKYFSIYKSTSLQHTLWHLFMASYFWWFTMYKFKSILGGSIFGSEVTGQEHHVIYHVLYFGVHLWLQACKEAIVQFIGVLFQQRMICWNDHCTKRRHSMNVVEAYIIHFSMTSVWYSITNDIENKTPTTYDQRLLFYNEKMEKTIYFYFLNLSSWTIKAVH